MRFKDCTIGYVKSIYQMKIQAEESKDTEKMEFLKSNYPEIFDAKFLMDFLKNEMERITNNLDDSMTFKIQLFMYQ